MLQYRQQHDSHKIITALLSQSHLTNILVRTHTNTINIDHRVAQSLGSLALYTGEGQRGARLWKPGSSPVKEGIGPREKDPQVF